MQKLFTKQGYSYEICEMSENEFIMWFLYRKLTNQYISLCAWKRYGAI